MPVQSGMSAPVCAVPRPGWCSAEAALAVLVDRAVALHRAAGGDIVTAADPLPGDLRHALDRIHHNPSAH